MAFVRAFDGSRKTKTLAAVVLATVLGAALPAPAQESSDMKLRDILAQGAKQLSAEEVNALVPGAKVKSIGAGGTVRTWTNESEGKLIAQSDDPTQRHLGNKRPQGPGTWRIADNGTYCVSIEWPQKTEQWCRYIYKAGEKYYAVKSTENKAADVHDIDFRR